MLDKVPRVRLLLSRLSQSSLVSVLNAVRKGTTRHEEIFTPRYGIRNLRDSQCGSYSGPGSTVERTAAIRDAIPILLEELSCRILIDAPCGDLKWIQHVELPVEQYIGVDVIRGLIELNNTRFANEQRSFMQLDMVEHVLPKGDLVLNRDMLIHLSFKDIARFLNLLKKSGCRYLLTSHFPEQPANRDIRTGEWRPVNLEIPPFNFPAPELTISEQYTQNKEHSDKCLALWETEAIPCFDPRGRR